MNRIETGSIFTAVRQRTGTSSARDWELLLTQDERGHNDIALFVENRPSGVKEGGKFRVEKIHSVSYGMKKDQSGEWRPSISVNADVTAVESYEEFKNTSDLSAEEEVSSGECPF
ncbi:MAG: hypothetical protein Q4F31_00140 [Eubacteriales bacterium]|nr:hypothetical protein [Eubacteriales bacterium]